MAFTILASLSMLVAAFALVAWAHSYRLIDYVEVRLSRPDDAPPRVRSLHIVSARGQLQAQIVAAPAKTPKEIESLRRTPFIGYMTRPLDNGTRTGIEVGHLSLSVDRRIDPAGSTVGNARLAVPYLLPLTAALILPAFYARALIRRRRRRRNGAPPAAHRTWRDRLAILAAATCAVGCLAFLVLCITSYFACGQSRLTYGAGTTNADLSVPGREISLALIRGRFGIFTGPYDLHETGPGRVRAFSFDWTWYPLAGAQLPVAGYELRVVRAFGVVYESESVPATTTRGAPTTRTMLILPFYPFIVLLALFFVLAMRHHRRATRARGRLARGLCPACGYDLRVTPDRCPECGTVVEATLPQALPR